MVPRSRPEGASRARPFLAILAALASLAGAQERPTPAALAQRTAELVQRLVQLEAAAADAAQLAAVQQQIDQLVAELGGDGFAVEHYVEVGSALLQHAPQAALAVSELGLQRFADSRFLLDHAGFAHAAIADGMRPTAARLGQLQQAEASFRKALQLQPDTCHAHFGLYQVLDLLDQPKAALAELEAALQLPHDDKAMPFLWLRRASLLLRSNQPAQALAVLQSGEIDATDQRLARILTLRAHALAGDSRQVQAQVETLLRLDASDHATMVAADALLWLGKRGEAVKLLGQRPASATGGDADELPQRQQVFAALQAIAAVKDPSTPSLRVPLTRALGHEFMVFDHDKSGKPREVDLSSSPRAMAQLLQSATVGTVKEWANHLLLALCLQALPGYRTPAQEAKLEAAMRVLPPADPSSLPALLVAMRTAVGDPELAGGLISLRAAQQLEPKQH